MIEAEGGRLTVRQETDVLPFGRRRTSYHLAGGGRITSRQETDVLPLRQETDVLPLRQEKDVLPLRKETDVLPLRQETDVLPLRQEAVKEGPAHSSFCGGHVLIHHRRQTLPFCMAFLPQLCLLRPSRSHLYWFFPPPPL